MRNAIVFVLMVLTGCRDSKPATNLVVTYDLPPEDMAVIPSGEYTVTAPLLPLGKQCTRDVTLELAKKPPYPQRIEVLPAFSIDKRRVGCQDYLACVRQHGCPPPRRANDEETDCKDVLAGSVVAEASSLVFAYVPRANAIAYCRWRGAQLPSYAQWQAAMRGPTGDRRAKCTWPEAERCEAVTKLGIVLSAGELPERELTRSTDCWPDNPPHVLAGEHPVMAWVALVSDRDDPAAPTGLTLDVPMPEVSPRRAGEEGERAFFRCVRESGVSE